MLTENQIKEEVSAEFGKSIDELMFDIVREANSEREDSASEKLNLDIIKHLIKRLDLHILNIEKKASFTNKLLIFLSIVGAIGAVFAVLDFFCK